ncbi:MAG TPA: hypothetical protein VIY08_13615 [Candidatus Nitrosocosmicus sp.]
MNFHFLTTKPRFPVIVVLISIVIVGIIGIPIGDKRFIIFAITLEIAYILLTVFVAKGYRISLYVCIGLAILIIIGNSFVSAHIYRILTLSKPMNAVVLIIGGYILQLILIYTSIMAIKKSKKIAR